MTSRVTYSRASAVCIALGVFGLSHAAQPIGVEFHDGLTKAVIIQVRPGGAAEAFGLRPGDEIVEVNGRVTYLPGDVRAAITAAKAGAPLQIVYFRDGVGRTMEIDHWPAAARAPRGRGDARPSLQACLRSPTPRCVATHALNELKSSPDGNSRLASAVATQFTRIGWPEAAREFLDVADRAFIAEQGPLQRFTFQLLARGHRYAAVPVPQAVLAKANAFEHQLDADTVAAGLIDAGARGRAEAILDDLARRRASDKGALRPIAINYWDLLKGYVLLGKLDRVDSILKDTPFSPRARMDLELKVAEYLWEIGNHAPIPARVDAALLRYLQSETRFDADPIAESVWVTWRAGDRKIPGKIGGFLGRHVKANPSMDVSLQSEFDAVPEVFALHGLEDDVAALIDARMSKASAQRRAEVEYRLVNGVARRSGDQRLNATAELFARRALANWKAAFAAGSPSAHTHGEKVRHLHRLLAAQGHAPPAGQDVEWPAGAGVSAEQRLKLHQEVARGTLEGLIASGRLKIASAWAFRHKHLLKEFNGLMATRDLMKAIGEESSDEAVKLGEEFDPKFAQTMARAAEFERMIRTRNFAGLESYYAVLPNVNMRVNALSRLLVPLSETCVTCND